MATQLLIYEQATPVSVARHRDWYVKSGKNYEFARGVNAVPLMASEFSAALGHYPIVFAGEDRIMPAAILGVRGKENLYVDEDGNWRSDYIPAFIRQYPFVLAGSEDDAKLTLCLDEEFVGCNREGQGERLFDVDGEQTTYLRTVLDFTQRYQADFVRTRAFCAQLWELGLLEGMSAQLRLPSGQLNLTGFKAVNRDKLKALPDDKLAALVQMDGMELIYAHLLSLRNFERLLPLVPTSEAAGESADSDGAAGEEVNSRAVE